MVQLLEYETHKVWRVATMNPKIKYLVLKCLYYPG